MLYCHAVMVPHKLWSLQLVTVHCTDIYHNGPPGQTLETNPATQTLETIILLTETQPLTPLIAKWWGTHDAQLIAMDGP